LVYADDVTLLGDDIETIKKNTQTLIDASKAVGLELFLPKIIDVKTTSKLYKTLGTEIWAFYIVFEFIINNHVTFVFSFNNLD
jgi:hypothetical protein